MNLIEKKEAKTIRELGLKNLTEDQRNLLRRKTISELSTIEAIRNLTDTSDINMPDCLKGFTRIASLGVAWSVAIVIAPFAYLSAYYTGHKLGLMERSKSK